MTKNNVEVSIQDNKVVYKRRFDVPISLAFEAWPVPEHLAQWWGPDGFTLTTTSMDFSNGGLWVFTMHGPDGHDYKNKIQFMEIKAPHSIVYKHMGDRKDELDVQFYASILLEEAGEGTAMTFEQVFASRAELERVNKEYGAIEGAKQHIGKFGHYVETLKQN